MDEEGDNVSLPPFSGRYDVAVLGPVGVVDTVGDTDVGDFAVIVVDGVGVVKARVKVIGVGVVKARVRVFGVDDR